MVSSREPQPMVKRVDRPPPIIANFQASNLAGVREDACSNFSPSLLLSEITIDPSHFFGHRPRPGNYHGPPPTVRERPLFLEERQGGPGTAAGAAGGPAKVSLWQPQTSGPIT